ncbi:DUF4153 domain-containing protein [Acidaminobacter sp. JC074]|uniref:DUF4153 domain-containing protein n=1 Tax=Acidaminobacter sp. JC074 TaxID=2530199 RepID=UPI001F0E0C39|nr:DUF4153 domain-containing protein [Acidaminobacter sp. JC074]MCH4889610.1 DUF4153 domain-containing protein [Acidaminobacter sp. JC074]
MSLKTSVKKSLRGAIEAVDIYPLVIIGAAIFTLTTMVRIQMDIERDTTAFLFDCIQMSLACMISYSLFSTALFKKLNKSILMSHVSSLSVLLVAFLALFMFSRPTSDAYTRMRVTDIATARIFIWISACFLAYIVFSARKSFSISFFVFLKALAIAFIYGSVLMSGTTGVAGAVQGLLYNDMSEKVYMHLSALVLFTSFTIFIGSFPSLDLEGHDPIRLTFEKKPNFIKILFTNIMIPIIGALTLVLLLWIGKALLGDWPNFNTVMGIVISYAIFGIFLYLMVLPGQDKIGDMYKKLFPFASILILLFGVYAFTRHISQEAFRGQEYYFILVILTSLVIMILMLVKKDKSQNVIPFLVMFSMVVSVLPMIGYHQLPVNLEVDRLASVLEDQGILVDGEIIGNSSIGDDLKGEITESVDYLVYSRDADLPEWLSRDLKEQDYFEDTFGFERTWHKREFNDDYVYLHLRPSSHSIEGYDYAVYLEHSKASFMGEKGWYDLQWINDSPSGIKIYLDDRLILEDYLEDYFIALDQVGSKEGGKIEDLSYKLESDEIDILMVFQYASFRRDDDDSNYAEVKVIYIKEK